MITRHAEATWNGDLMKGKGTVKTNSGVVNHPYSFQTRFENGPGTNPEELLGASHAACFSMALSGVLTKDGHPPTSIHTTAAVHIDPVEGGFAITKIELETVGEVPGIDAAAFEAAAAGAKAGCPLSKALKAVDIHLKTTFKS